MSEEAGSRISVDQLTEAAFGGVLAAMRTNAIDPKLFPGPILVGIVAWPELGKGDISVFQSPEA